MLSSKIRTAAAVLTAAFAVSLATGPLTTGDAHAATKAGTTTSKPKRTAGAVAKVKANPTGNATLDDYCRKVADLVNDAFKQSGDADIAGNYSEGKAWWDLAIDILRRAKANGCNFTQYRLRADSSVRVTRGGGVAVR